MRLPQALELLGDGELRTGHFQIALPVLTLELPGALGSRVGGATSRAPPALMWARTCGYPDASSKSSCTSQTPKKK